MATDTTDMEERRAGLSEAAEYHAAEAERYETVRGTVVIGGAEMARLHGAVAAIAAFVVGLLYQAAEVPPAAE